MGAREVVGDREGADDEPDLVLAIMSNLTNGLQGRIMTRLRQSSIFAMLGFALRTQYE